MNIDWSNTVCGRKALKMTLETMTADLFVNWTGLNSRTAVLTKNIHLHNIHCYLSLNLRRMFSLFSPEMLFEVLSWGRGEFLFQRLNVCEQDGPSSSSGFQHLTLQTQGANVNIWKIQDLWLCTVAYLDKFGPNLSVRDELLVGQHVSLALGQVLLTGWAHLDGVGDVGLQNRAQVQARGRCVIQDLLPTGKASVQWPNWCFPLWNTEVFFF